MVADSAGSIDAPSREESLILFYFIFENDSRNKTVGWVAHRK